MFLKRKEGGKREGEKKGRKKRKEGREGERKRGREEGKERENIPFSHLIILHNSFLSPLEGTHEKL